MTLPRQYPESLEAPDPDCLLAADYTDGDPTVTVTVIPSNLDVNGGRFSVEIRDAGGGHEEWFLLDPGSAPHFVWNVLASGYRGTTPYNHATNSEVRLGLLVGPDFTEVVDGRDINPHTVKVNADWGHDGDAIITAALTANQNNYAPTGHATAAVIRLDPDANRNITGFTAPSPEYARRVVFENIDTAFSVTFKAEDASSTAANRFGVATDVAVGPQQNVEWLYDGTLDRWLLIGGTGSGSSVSLSDADPSDTAVTADPGVSPDVSRADHVHQLGDHDHSASGGEGGTVSWDDLTDKPTLPTYTITNVTTDRTYDANATTVDEVADVLGTLVADLGAAGMGGGGGGGSLPPWLTFTAPPTTGWSWDNQGSSTITSTASKQYLHAPAQSALHAALRYRTAPSTPYNCDFALMHGTIGVEGQTESRVGYLVAFRDAGGKLIAFRFSAYDGSYTISIDKWTSATVFSAVYAGYATNGGTILLLARAPQWLRLRDDGTDLKFYYSIDGEEWILFATHARGDFLSTGPNAIGFGALPENGDCDVSLVHYAES
jgi:hypothetical protein